MDISFAFFAGILIRTYSNPVRHISLLFIFQHSRSVILFCIFANFLPKYILVFHDFLVIYFYVFFHRPSPEVGREVKKANLLKKCVDFFEKKFILIVSLKNLKSWSWPGKTLIKLGLSDFFSDLCTSTQYTNIPIFCIILHQYDKKNSHYWP